MKFSLILFLFSSAQASTFVGNGGSAGDVELLVTRKQVIEAIELLDEVKLRNVCECSEEFKDREICEPLRELNEARVKFCSQTLVEKKTQLLELLQTPGRVEFRWTHESIEVAEGSRKRSVEAVADRTKNQITINQDRFLNLASWQRIFLISHELFHFLALNDKPITDEGEVPPFDGADGSKKLVDSMASAITLNAVDNYLVNRYKPTLNRPQGWKQNWIEFKSGTENRANANDTTFGIQSVRTQSFSYRYHFSNLGVVGEYRSAKGDRSVLTTIKANEKIQVWSLGLAYKIFPFSDPLTFWGQTHFLVQGLARYLKSEYDLSDTFVGLSESATAWGGGLTTAYYIPLLWNLWASVHFEYNIIPYELKKVSVKYNNSTSALLGVSYAF